MNNIDLLLFLLIWSLIGAILFSLFVIVVYITGMVHTARDDEGHLKKKMPVKGILSMILTLSVIIGFLVCSHLLWPRDGDLGFFELWGINLTLICILFTYDTVVIDFLVLSVWRPKLLKITFKGTAPRFGHPARQ